MPQQDRLNIAVFIDFDNIEIGVKNTLGQQMDIGTILEAIKERGEVVTKIAYADWTRAGEYSRALTQHAIRLVQRNLTPGGDKNGADINLALDALEMAFTHPHINAYVIVGGDSDFLSLVEKLKQYDKKVFVVGGRGFTSIILQRNCHEFIAYENLAGVRKAAARSGRATTTPALSPIVQAFPIVRRALKILADREVSPQTGLLKSTLLQLDSTFSERNYGASSFLDFAEKLAQSGLVQLKTAGRSVMVELNPGFSEGDPVPVDSRIHSTPGLENENGSAVVEAPRPLVPPPPTAAYAPATATFAPAEDTAPQATESAAEGVRVVGEILRKATNARWPMYIRNVKQLLRAADGGFDERRYGFGGLMDLLRACQREGLLRMERDRRGGLRVFSGSSTRPQPIAVPQDNGLEPVSVSAPAPAGESTEIIDADMESEPVDLGQAAVDTTAELLGRAKPRRARARAVPSLAARKPSGRSAPASGQRKPAVRRTARPKKAAAPDDDDDRGNS